MSGIDWDASDEDFGGHVFEDSHGSWVSDRHGDAS